MFTLLLSAIGLIVIYIAWLYLRPQDHYIPISGYRVVGDEVVLDSNVYKNRKITMPMSIAKAIVDARDRDIGGWIERNVLDGNYHFRLYQRGLVRLIINGQERRFKFIVIDKELKEALLK